MPTLHLSVRAPDAGGLVTAPSPEDKRLRITDRLALRLGVWLLLRSAARLAVQPSHTEHHRRRLADAARDRREAAARQRYLHGPLG